MQILNVNIVIYTIEYKTWLPSHTIPLPGPNIVDVLDTSCKLLRLSPDSPSGWGNMPGGTSIVWVAMPFTSLAIQNWSASLPFVHITSPCKESDEVLTVPNGLAEGDESWNIEEPVLIAESCCVTARAPPTSTQMITQITSKGKTTITDKLFTYSQDIIQEVCQAIV